MFNKFTPTICPCDPTSAKQPPSQGVCMWHAMHAIITELFGMKSDDEYHSRCGHPAESNLPNPITNDRSFHHGCLSLLEAKMLYYRQKYWNLLTEQLLIILLYCFLYHFQNTTMLSAFNFRKFFSAMQPRHTQ